MVLLDLELGSTSGHAVMNFITEQQLNLPVVIVSGRGGIDDVIQVFRTNAFDYIKKPFDTNNLVNVIKRAVAFKRDRDKQN